MSTMLIYKRMDVKDDLCCWTHVIFDVQRVCVGTIDFRVFDIEFSPLRPLHEKEREKICLIH